MLYNPPTGGLPNDPYLGKNVAAGQQGSKVPPGAIEFPQREIMAVIAAAMTAGLQIQPSNADLTQLHQAIKFLIPKYAPVAATPATYGATSKGGLKLDGSKNFLLDLIANLNADNRAQPVDGDILAIGRATDGAMVGVSAAKLGAYISSLFQQNTTFSQITPTNLVGLSLAAVGDYNIPRGAPATVPFQPITVNSAFGTVSNGVLTVAKAGYYLITFSGAMFISSNGHANDFAKFLFNLAPGGYLSTSQPIPSGGGQAQGNFLGTTVQHLAAGDTVKVQATIDNFAQDGVNAGVSAYTNMLVALLNS